MNYQEIKDQYPVGCEVELKPIKANNSWGSKIPQGIIAIVLDPNWYGEKCILFMSDQVRVSKENSNATIRRKLPKLRTSHPDHKYKFEKRGVMKGSWQIGVIDEKILTEAHNKKGFLKWIKPSDIKAIITRDQNPKYQEADFEPKGTPSMIGTEGPEKFEKVRQESLDNGLSEDEYHQEMTNQISRTEYLKSILKLG